jgi:hypothetical protein
MAAGKVNDIRDGFPCPLFLRIATQFQLIAYTLDAPQACRIAFCAFATQLSGASSYLRWRLILG